MDSFTEVTEEGYFSRIKNAIGGVLVGLILIIASIPILWFNEGRAVNRAKTLTEGASSVLSVTPDEVDSANEDKLVHMTGKAETTDTVLDKLFGVETVALRLRRVAEMYQWVEDKKERTEKKLGGGTRKKTRYTYSKQWKTNHINSGSFKKSEGHQNPASMPYTSTTVSAAKVTLGAFTLSSLQVACIRSWEDFLVDDETLNAATLPEKGRIKLSAGGYYLGDAPASPQVGDTKITFKVVEPTVVSIYASQKGDSFKPYKTTVGGELQRLELGDVSAAEMFENAQSENTIFTWILRGVGFVLMLIGFSLVFRPLSVVADLVPFIGSLIGMGTVVIAFVLSFALSLVTISLAWLFYRPLLGIILLAIAGGVVFLGIKFANSRKAARLCLLKVKRK